MNTNLYDIAQREHQFWLQILGDHSRFIFFALSPNEVSDIETSRKFIAVFDQLLEESRRASLENLPAITQNAVVYAKKLRAFKLSLIKKLLTKSIKMNMTPTFLNHMVNELEEYIRILSYLINEQIPPTPHPVHHHLVWLLDASGHVSAIQSNLDEVEKKVRKKANRFKKDFKDFYLKAVEMAGFLRTNLEMFPALARFDKQVVLEITIFQEFLKELEEMELNKETLSHFSPLMADHMYREECYYLTKLAEANATHSPDCNPAKPRIEE